ncbi:unnamed protein product [Ectocarpus sp. CCAP 1310/34]|nr:unnamed protein product [Ectocarpus sp. CCAP 1310/34]
MRLSFCDAGVNSPLQSRETTNRSRWYVSSSNKCFVFANVPQTSAYPGPLDYTMAQTDRKALVALYNATGRAKWEYTRNWNTSAALSQWHGVEVNCQGRVVKLSLGGNNL